MNWNRYEPELVAEPAGTGTGETGIKLEPVRTGTGTLRTEPNRTEPNRTVGAQSSRPHIGRRGYDYARLEALKVIMHQQGT